MSLSISKTNACRAVDRRSESPRMCQLQHHDVALPVLAEAGKVFRNAVEAMLRTTSASMLADSRAALADSQDWEAQ